MAKKIMVSVNVIPDTQEEAYKAVEILSRAVAGIGFDGINVSLSINYYEELEDEL